MFQAFLVETGYFISKEFHPYFGPEQPSLANVVIRKKYLPYRPPPSDSAGQRFFKAERGNVAKTIKTAKRGKAPFNKDKRRRHHHFLVTVYYADGEKFGRVYTDKEKATRFADRQRRSPVVKSVRVSQVS
jgi:hypothetical protein